MGGKQKGLRMDLFKNESHHFGFGWPAQIETKEFQFGESNGAHETIRAKDLNAAVWKFMIKVTSLWDYVPESCRKTDSEEHWVGHYDSHTDMFVPDYAPDACIRVFVKDELEWKPIGMISPYTGESIK